MIMWHKRRKVSRKWKARIMPHIVKQLHEKSRDLTFQVTRTSDTEAEVQCKAESGYRHVVNLSKWTCTCREWQVCGQPCVRAIAFIGHVRGSIEDYVDDCYSVENFRAAYEHIIPGLVDKSQWPKERSGETKKE